MQEEDDIRQNLHNYLIGKDFELNCDEQIVNDMIYGMARNVRKHGKPYCTCRLITGNEEVDKAGICPCESHLEDIELNGECHCQLFVAKKK